MSDVEVLEEMAKHGPHAPNLWGVSGAQWQRIITMLNMMEACIRIGADPRMLYFQPEFFGAHRRYGGNSRVA